MDEYYTTMFADQTDLELITCLNPSDSGIDSLTLIDKIQ